MKKTGGTAPGNEVGMKGSFLWKLMWLLCALAGILAGYGIFRLTGAQGIQQNNQAKDNTLVRGEGDSVFFDGITTTPTEDPVELEGTGSLAVPAPEGMKDSAVAESPGSTTDSAVTESPGSTTDSAVTELPEQDITPAPTEKLMPTVAPPDYNTANVVSPATLSSFEDSSQRKLPALSEVISVYEHQWAETGSVMVPTPVVSQEATGEQTDAAQQPGTTEVITYPTKIFGQIPVINRSDAYVSYFEFCYDVVTMLEAKVEQRGLSMNALLAKFVIKALFCGVDVEKLDINAPIPRKDAALVLWLAAQLLEEKGHDTSAKTAGQYVTDISGCSGSVKKAVAYLYEQGILPGYQVAGQRFYPEDGLKTESGEGWLSRAKQGWK